MRPPHERRVLLTGATGYVGGRLAPLLLSRGHAVRCLVRNPTRVQGRSWAAQAQVAAGDVLRPDTLAPALVGIHTAYYLIRVVGGSADSWQANLQGARHFAQAARAAGLKHIVYLSDLAEVRAAEAQHAGRPLQIGEVLRESGVPVTELRAAGIIGSGSLVFELVRSLVERSLFVPCPRLFHKFLQPIALQTVLDYLAALLEAPTPAEAVIELGGPEALTFAQMLLRYAQLRRLRRALLPVPGWGRGLAGWWIHLSTPIPRSAAGPFLQGLASGLLADRHPVAGPLPPVQQLDFTAALGCALAESAAGRVETSWRDALGGAAEPDELLSASANPGRLTYQCRRLARASSAAVHQACVELGGARGWLFWHWAWQLRGACDRFLGGVGMQRGRRAPGELRVGDALDFWRVESLAPSRLLRLRAEMKVPGLAWLQFEVLPSANGHAELVQTACFDPAGRAGKLYWYSLYLIHRLIFRGLVRRLAREAEAMDCPQSPGVRS